MAIRFKTQLTKLYPDGGGLALTMSDCSHEKGNF